VEERKICPDCGYESPEGAEEVTCPNCSATLIPSDELDMEDELEEEEKDGLDDGLAGDVEEDEDL
jgi:hypothetical protein